MAIIGYARVSSVGQDLTVQMDKLSAAGCEKVFTDKKSGTSGDRQGLNACLDYLREGDTLVITKLDRLARSTLQLTQIASQFEEDEVDLLVLDQAIDTSTPTGKLLFNVLSAIAEFETEIRRERQLEGIAKAKERGVRFGRSKKLTEEVIESIREKRNGEGATIAQISSQTGLSRSTIYRALSEYDEGGSQPSVAA